MNEKDYEQIITILNSDNDLTYDDYKVLFYSEESKDLVNFYINYKIDDSLDNTYKLISDIKENDLVDNSNNVKDILNILNASQKSIDDVKNLNSDLYEYLISDDNVFTDINSTVGSISFPQSMEVITEPITITDSNGDVVEYYQASYIEQLKNTENTRQIFYFIGVSISIFIIYSVFKKLFSKSMSSI